MHRWKPFLDIKFGTARVSILIGGVCFKFPRIDKGLLAWHRGFYSNFYEGTWYKWSRNKASLVPILYNKGCFGFLLIEERCVMKRHTAMHKFDNTTDGWGTSLRKNHEVLVDFFDREHVR